MEGKKYRVTGRCFHLNDDKSLVGVPTGTIVEIVELPGAMLMRWYSAANERREQYYTPEAWKRRVSKQIEPIEKV